MSKDPRHALHELRDYFEQKRNLAIRDRTATDERGALHMEKRQTVEADCYNHAMEMVAEYLREVEKR